MKWAWYNEIDAYAAQWLRNLICAKLIMDGEVDERPIQDVKPYELRKFIRCHFFAGIAGWDYALTLAGWPVDRPIWTGSNPCQPFSTAGKRKQFADERHLWPFWFHLISVCKPPTVFGEQVSSKLALEWFDLVQADLESAEYAVGSADLCAASVGAPHIRQRLWFVADAGYQPARRSARSEEAERGRPFGGVAGRGVCGLADPNGRHPSPEGIQRGGEHGQRAEDGGPRRVGDAERPRLQEQRGLGSLPSGESGTDAREAAERAGASVGGMGDAPGRGNLGQCEAGKLSKHIVAGEVNCWSDVDWLPCTDGKARPVEPGSFPLAHGIQRRASKLRAYGNAIVPKVAAEFIKAYLACRP